MDNSAFDRGRRAAGFWLRLSKSAKEANDICISWTKRRGLPAFVGRLPVPIAGLMFLTFVALSGLFIGAILVIGAVFLYMLSNLSVTGAEDSDDTDELSGHQYRDGNDGFGMYSGPQNVTVTSTRIDRDDEDD
ncbi:DUF3742 family protein (plasmid) [Pantoea piersonii]|uniref:DUF3742 family protein n=1 Tax=Pantoea piersonii TaxID=2364647 RepID=A0AAJ5QN96_9GAMM|nr:hypothetical protein [Pantoea piersonii]POW52747.1 hypothetical protein C3408_24220 [Pantoea alvi]WBG93597.1 DUF3742 family protein [Pantoea piersonii]